MSQDASSILSWVASGHGMDGTGGSAAGRAQATPSPQDELAGATHELQTDRGPQSLREGDTPTRAGSFMLGRAESHFPTIGAQHRGSLGDAVEHFFSRPIPRP
jgi:hypothetical protein